MRKINRSIDIGASVDRVFEFLTQPDNLPGIWPSLIEVQNVQRRDDGWNSFDWTYKMAGMRFHGKSTTTNVEKNTSLEQQNEGGIPSKFRWKFQGRDGSSARILLDVEYTVPAPILGKIAEALVAKMNEHEMDVMLANLKATLEGAPREKPADAARARV